MAALKLLGVVLSAATAQAAEVSDGSAKELIDSMIQILSHLAASDESPEVKRLAQQLFQTAFGMA